jgi:hypothetical protein
MSKPFWRRTSVVLLCTAMVLAAARLGAVREAAIHFSSGPATLVPGQGIRLNAVNDDVDSNHPNRAVPVRLTLLECGHPGGVNTPPLASGDFSLRPGECASVSASASPNSPQTHVWALASGGIPGGGCIRPSLEVYDVASGQTTAVYPITEERDSANRD